MMCPLEACVLQVNVALLCHPKITFTNFYVFLSHFGAFLESTLIFAKKYVHFSKQFVQIAPLNRLPAKACNLFKIFSSSFKSKYLCQWTYQCHQNEKSLCHCSQTRLLSHVVNITVHSVSITWCKLWQKFGWQLQYCTEVQKAALLMYAIYPFKSTNLHVTVCGILIERVCFEMFKLLRICSISQYLAAPFIHCKAMIDNVVHNSGPYFIWYAPMSLASSLVLYNTFWATWY